MDKYTENQTAGMEKDYFSKIGEYGQLIVISGPKAVGKRTIVREYLKAHPKAYKCPTVTTREMRAEEVDGEDHYFVSNSEFERMVRTHMLIDYTYINGNGYGTTKKAIEEARKAGKNVILIEDVESSIRVKMQCEDATLIFIAPADWEWLEKRIRERHKDNPALVEENLIGAQEEILCADQFDYILVNDSLEKTLNRLGQIIHGLRYSKNSMRDFLKSYIKSEIIPSEYVNELKSLRKS